MISMTILSLIYISIITFRLSEFKKYEKRTSRIPVFGIQEVQKANFKNSDNRKSAKLQVFR